ncbi:MAG: chemotaxis protein CheW [Anaerolineae bacterium]|nr:chemotaxis protein CheW [Anaerolineae bacterium]
MSFYEHFSEQELAILRARAERIANTQDEVKQGDMVSVLVIQAGGETYGLPMDSLMAVYMEHTIIPVPCVPSYVAGIANIRGEIMPVFDLAVLLKAPVSETKHALIVASSNENSVAFCVESVGESRTVQLSSLQAVPPMLNEAYLQGISADGMALLNMEGIINDPALIVDEAIS